MRKPARLIIPFVLIAALAGAGGWFAFMRNTAPDEEVGRAWLAGFADLITSSRLLGARGPAALALFPQLGAWPVTGCQAEWRKSDGLGPIVVSQHLELARQEADPCDQAQFGQLSTVLRQSEGVTPGALVDRLTEQFGVPRIHRDASLSGSASYEWDLQYAITVRLEEPVGPGGGDTFSVAVTRFLGAPAAIPTAEDGERWLDWVVALLTGPELVHSHGMQAVRLVDAAMRADPALGGGCSHSFSTSGASVKQSIAYDKTLILADSESGCGNGAFVQLFLTARQRPPVTVQALVERLQSKLGPPALHRDFRQQELAYEWTTAAGATLGVVEFIDGTDRDLIIHFSRN